MAAFEQVTKKKALKMTKQSLNGMAEDELS